MKRYLGRITSPLLKVEQSGVIYCTKTNEIVGANASIALSTYDLSSEGVQDPGGGDDHCSFLDSKQMTLRAPVPWLHPLEGEGRPRITEAFTCPS